MKTAVIKDSKLRLEEDVKAEERVKLWIISCIIVKPMKSDKLQNSLESIKTTL